MALDRAPSLLPDLVIMTAQLKDGNATDFIEPIPVSLDEKPWFKLISAFAWSSTFHAPPLL